MNTNFKVIAPLIAGLLFFVFAALILIIGDFMSDWPVAVIPIIFGAFFIALSAGNSKKLKES